ncbi:MULTISPECIES: hypothetical protein [unclassified Xanthomonas]|uniref:hypothetical protein n=1 Tax=unclassified Xanthomonas TaxID=2643310 RepID=UPI0028832CD0|nr:MULTISPECIES: hypothetical protein [unclassified Xanthomonas]
MTDTPIALRQAPSAAASLHARVRLPALRCCAARPCTDAVTDAMAGLSPAQALDR